MDAELVTQIIYNLYKSRLIEGRDFSYSSVYINDVQIYFMILKFMTVFYVLTPTVIKF